MEQKSQHQKGKTINPKKILLVSPCSKKSMAEVKWMSPPLGIARLQGFLKSKGHEVEFYDINFNIVTGEGISFEEKLEEKEWDIIGFSTLDDTLVKDIENMYIAKKVRPNALLLAGGIESQFNYQTILDKSPCKVVILGEGEVPMLLLANDEPFHKIPGIVFRNDAIPLNNELFWEATDAIDWERMQFEKYWDFYVSKYGKKMNEEADNKIHTARVFSRNRCPFGCNFCSSTHQLTRASKRASVPIVGVTDDKLMEVIKRIIKAHPRVKTIYLSDDDFCAIPSRVTSFCNKIIENKINVRFICFARISDLNEEVLENLAKANFKILNIGVESFSQNALNDMSKKYDIDIVHKNLELVKKYDIHPFINVILITPNSTLDDVEETVDQTLKYLKDGSCSAGIALACIPFKGSNFYEMYSDFMTKVEKIPGTEFFIKKDLMIFAKDPAVKEMQLRFYNEVDEEIVKKIKEENIVHPTPTKLATMKLDFMKSLVNQARKKHGLKKGQSASIQQEKPKERKGDSFKGI
jgi:radical SAM superfamily enzyme YgiQ (UPF0313 family)